MYFIMLNAAIAIFFLFLIIIGLLLKYHSFLPINIIGILIIVATIYFDKTNELLPGNIILIMLALVIIFITDVIFIFRDFRDEVTEEDAIKLKKYLLLGSNSDHFKLIRDEKIIKADINSHKNVPLSDRVQALELIKQGNEFAAKNNLQEAMEKYDLSCNLVESAVGYLNQSGVLLKSGQFEDALVLAQKAGELQPKFYEAILNQAVALEKLNRSSEALKKYEAAAKLKPDDFEIWFCIANIHFKMENYSNAIKYFDKALELNGRLFEAWYLKGISLQRLEKLPEALRSFENGIQLKPRHAKSYFRMGNILTALDRDSDAIASYEKSLRLNPESDVCWNNLGVVLNKVGRISDAIKCYDRAIKINEKYAEAWFNRALAYETLGKERKALECYQRFSEIAPSGMAQRKEMAKKRISEIKSKFKKKKTFQLPPWFKGKKKQKANRAVSES